MCGVGVISCGLVVGLAVLSFLRGLLMTENDLNIRTDSTIYVSARGIGLAINSVPPSVQPD